MQRRALLDWAKNWPPKWVPLPKRLPRFPHPLPVHLAHVAYWFHALSDTSRIHILEFLSQRDRFVTELRKITGMPHSSVLFHLKVLKESGLVRAYRVGRRKYFSIQPDTLADMAALTRRVAPGAHQGTCPWDCCRLNSAP